MRESFAHEATVEMDGDGDRAAPGGAITLRLCGSFNHPGPCPLAPHHTAAEHVDGAGSRVRLRVLFAADPNDEAMVRREIDVALAGGTVLDPQGVERSWRLLESGPSPVRSDEREHAGRLVNA